MVVHWTSISKSAFLVDELKATEIELAGDSEGGCALHRRRGKALRALECVKSRK